MANKNGAATPTTLEEWLNGRPSWLRMAADGLVRDRRAPNAQEIDALTDHCLQEAANTLPAKHPALAPGVILGTPTAGALSIDSVSEIRGVNAIGPDAVLGLSKKGMTVVYGSNGSGKSGYARLMKHICGARAKGVIHRKRVRRRGASRFCSSRHHHVQCTRRIICRQHPCLDRSVRPPPQAQCGASVRLRNRH